AYYFVSLLGISLAKQGRIPAGAGVWLANVVFFAGGLFLLFRVDKRPLDFSGWLRTRFGDFKPKPGRLLRWRPGRTRVDDFGNFAAPAAVRRTRFPLILDQYVVSDFVLYLLMIQATFIVLFLVFTLFERVGDILRNHVALTTVGE